MNTKTKLPNIESLIYLLKEYSEDIKKLASLLKRYAFLTNELKKLNK